MPLWTALYVLLFWPLLLGACIAAWRWGGKPERYVATAYAVAAIFEMLLRSRHGFAQLELGVAIVDICLLVALLFILVRQGRPWIYAAAAVQMVVVTGHLAKLLVPAISRMTYIIMTGAGGYPQVLLLVAGTIAHVLAKRTHVRASRSAGGPIFP